MVYHFLDYLREAFPDSHIGFYGFQNLLFRCIMAALTGLAIAFFTAPRIIRMLLRMKIGDRPEFHHAALNALMRERANTPTMGGLIILLAVIVSTVLWAKMDNQFIHKALVILIWFGAIGGTDDWLKLTAKSHQRNRDGLRAWEKLVLQFGCTSLIAIFLYSDMANIPDALRFWLPFYKQGIPLAKPMFAVIAVLYISATSNAVNLTDGMDGLAPGCIGIVAGVLVVLCYITSETMAPASDRTWASYLLIPHIPQSGELSVFFASIVGAILGFLWYNCHPAQVFMGDTGSLSLGAAVGYGAVVTRNEILLFIIGGVFIMELFSVILQVGYFKYTGGKRLFRCAPIHHHFHLAGWSEPQVVVRFWLLSMGFAVLALATLKIR
ncbi:MAG TPA: phospho-N-acetylmuramoyl-pentapeptide-transferase [Anaerohalosphaeraceae bacterium]|nr:phospho-N-acetylmuramoyl-pentapeptide-transferase [Anaerohalosphaeraceae bacterium]HRT49027.1 phospho-N-acetylmuramoyl-pentapeptide-transferase [Anaerohalosphaeraceae bacterium]HRT85150.1 phospho-N-acetylmuramoyl-pentapeptide-transferase [Anaerohalosphaeraceae bacterium]